MDDVLVADPPSGTVADVSGAVLSVSLLGSFEIRCGRTALGARDLGGGRPRQIFEILALDAGSTVSKTRLIELLWPGAVPGEAAATLESYVSVLRQRLLAVSSSRTAVVRTVPGGYLIDRGRIDLDVDRLAAAVAAAQRAEPARALALLEQVLPLLESPLLAEEALCAWADDVRRGHAQRTTAALLAAADAAARSGRTELALELAERVLVAEPLSESAWSVKLGALEDAGRHAEALRAYRDCRQAFARELGCPPGPLLQAVLHRLMGAAAAHDDELGELMAALLRVQEHARAAPGRAASAEVRQAVAVLDDLLARARERTRSGVRGT